MMDSKNPRGIVMKSGFSWVALSHVCIKTFYKPSVKNTARDMSMGGSLICTMLYPVQEYTPTCTHVCTRSGVEEVMK